MKVLIISNYQDALNSVRPEGEMFIELHNMGVEVVVMTPNNAEFVPFFREAGIRVIDFRPKKKWSWSAIQFIRQELKNGKYDLLHLFNSKAVTNGVWAAMGLPVKVLTYRGVLRVTHWYNPVSYLKHLHPRVDGITAVSKAVQRHLQHQLFRNPSKVKQFYKGQNLTWYAAIQPADLKEFSIKKQDLVVACIANYRKTKGVHFLIQATHYLPPGLPLHFLLIGRGLDIPNNKTLIEGSPYRSRIHLTGYRNDVLRLLMASDVYVQPSDKNGEGLGKAISEAMSLGVPPIVTESGGPPEFVENNQTGLVVPVRNPQAIAQAIMRYYEEETFRQTIGKNARHYIRTRMTIRQSAEKLRAIYAFFVRNPKV